MPKMTEEKNRIWLASSSSERLLWLAATLAKLGVSSEVLLRAIASPVKEPADLPAEVITCRVQSVTPCCGVKID